MLPLRFCAITSSRAEHPLCVPPCFRERDRLTVLVFLYSLGLLLSLISVYTLSCVSNVSVSIPSAHSVVLDRVLTPHLDADYYYYGTAGGRRFWVRSDHSALPTDIDMFAVTDSGSVT
jgi:hypothetical protein